MRPGPKPKQVPREALEGKSVEEAAFDLGVGKTTILRLRREHGITSVQQGGRYNPIPDEVLERWVRLYSVEKMPLDLIYRRYGGEFSRKRISEAIRAKLGIDKLEVGRRTDEGWVGSP